MTSQPVEHTTLTSKLEEKYKDWLGVSIS